MLNDFISKLEKLLNQYYVSEQEKADIINDYQQMIEDGIQRNLSQQTIIDMIGSPEKIVKELGYRYKKSTKNSQGEKIIALTPFISAIIFLILGYTKELWHPGWLIFFLIPVTAIIIELPKDKEKYLFTALSPFISIGFYILFGSLYEIWHPTWLIFLIIPALGIAESKSEMDNLTFLTALSPFISLSAFILLQYFTGDFKYTWLVFLLIIFLGIFHEKDIKKKTILFSSLFLSTLLYVLIMISLDNWLGLLSFSILIIAGITAGKVKLAITDRNNLFIILISLFSFSAFLGVGYYLNLWVVSWLFLFIIPVVCILKQQNNKHALTPLSPFIAVTLLVLAGYFFDLWYISWMALLLIPITAIIENS